MIILSHDDVADLLPMQEAIEVVESVMKQVSRGTATLPLRSVTPVGGNNRMGLMPGAIADPACFGVKMVSLFPDNPSRGLSSHRGAMVLFEAETGTLAACAEAVGMKFDQKIRKIMTFPPDDRARMEARRLSL